MSIRGVPQLVRLELSYSVLGGSSLGVRDFIRSRLVDFHSAHSAVSISLVKRANVHPQWTAFYKNGRRTRVPLRSKTSCEVFTHAERLRSSTGRPQAPRVWALPESRSPSIQGAWDESFSHVSLHRQVQQRVAKQEKILGVARAARSPGEKKENKKQ